MVANEILPTMSEFVCQWAINDYDQYENEIGTWSCTIPIFISYGNFLLLISFSSKCIIF
jgi:hypothetical protein